MWFNFVLNNHGPIEICDELSPLTDYFRGALSRCGHETTVVYDNIYENAINIYFEYFEGEDFRRKLIDFRKSHDIKIGVVATELMVGGTIPYGKTGIVYRDGPPRDDALPRRIAGFNEVAANVDFVWSILERTAAEYRSIAKSSEFFPVGHVSDIPSGTLNAPKDIDVVFFGTLTPHRNAALTAMVNRGLKVLPVGRGFPMGHLPRSLLLSLLDRAKIGVNLTLATDTDTPGIDPRFTSCMRIKEMLDREICVVSEIIPLDNPYAEFMVCAPVSHLAETCRTLLDGGQWRETGRAQAAAFRGRMDVADVCGPVIDRTLAALKRG